MLKIAFLTKSFKKGEVDAAISTIINLGKELKKRGHEVTIVTDRGYVSRFSGKLLEKHEIIEGIDVFRPYHVPTRFFGKLIKPLLLLSRTILPGLGVRLLEKRQGKFDVIHSFSGAHFFLLNGKFCRPKKHVHTQKSKSAYNKHRFDIGSNKYAFLLNFADVITVPLNIMKKELIDAGVKKPVKVVRSYIALDNFYEKSNVEELRRIYALPQDKKIILYYGHFNPNKGIHDLLYAFKELSARRKDIVLLILHPTYAEKKDEQLIKDSTTQGNIVFREGKVNIVDYINAVDAVVLPYRNVEATEANPLCILETLACNAKLLTADLPEIREIIKSDKNVVLIKPNNKEALINGIVRILKLKKSKYPRDKLKEFSLSYCAEQFEKIYRS